MKNRLPCPDRNPIPEIALIAFGLGILLAFFLSTRALALIESLLIIALGIVCLKKG